MWEPNVIQCCLVVETLSSRVAVWSASLGKEKTACATPTRKRFFLNLRRFSSYSIPNLQRQPGQLATSRFGMRVVQLLQMRMFDRRHPVITKIVPASKPQGKRKNMQMKPITSSPSPSGFFWRRRTIVATGASLPGKRNIWPHCGQFASAPTSALG